MRAPIEVGVGAQGIARAPRSLRALGVGSCVVVALYDRRRAIGGLAHLPLPARGRPSEQPERFIDSGLELLLRRLGERGCRRADLEVKAAGGATLLVSSNGRGDTSIASSNLRALRATLARLGLVLAAEDLGGDVARSVELDTRTGALRVAPLRRESTAL
jgi:chemotaxis protein CheD